MAHCKSGTRSYLLWAAGEALTGRRNAEDLVKQAAAEGYDLSGLPALLARLGKRSEPQLALRQK